MQFYLIFMFLDDKLENREMNKYNLWACGAVVAQLTLNQLVVGSNPTAPSYFFFGKKKK